MKIKKMAAALACVLSCGVVLSQTAVVHADGWWDDANQVWHEGYYTEGWWDDASQTWHDGTFVETGTYAPAASQPTYTYSVSLPYYLQTDPTWSYLNYGGYTIGNTGCGVTSIAMILSGVLGYTVTPNMVADVCYAAGTYNHPELGYGVGTLGNARYTAAGAYGAVCEGIYDYNTFIYDLQAGMPVSIMTGAGTLYGASHGIAVIGYSNGKTQVYDPLGGYTGWYDAARVYNWHSTSWQDMDAGTTVFAFHA